MKRKRRPTLWTFNMTPLIDVTFLLLTYFMLASHYASAERPDAVEIPKPHQSQAEDRFLEEKVYVNMLYEAGGEPVLMFGPLQMGSFNELKERLNAIGQAAPQTQVVLRADRRIPYGEVRQVMEAIAAAHLPNVEVVAELEALK